MTKGQEVYYSNLKAVVGQVVEMVVHTGAWKATKYLSPNYTVKATRKMYGRKTTRGRRIDMRDRNIDLTVTIGRPNYVEREFIKDCKAAGVPFPVKKVQLKFPPKRRAA